MLRLIINITLVIVFLITCNKAKSNRQENVKTFSTPLTIIKPKVPDVLICSGNQGSGFKKFVKDNDIKEVKFVNDAQFLSPSKKFAFDEKLLQEQVRLAYPDAKATGIAYIDIEHPYMEYLINEDVNSPNFKQSLKLFLDVLKFVKMERPNVKWGYYYIPFTTYWDRTEKFYEKHKKVQEIIKNSDVLFPSIYIFYNNVNFDFENIEYLKSNTKEAIKIAKLYNKEVYPFIMSRYHPSNKNLGNARISDKNFKTYVSAIMKTQYSGENVDGIILWNFDDYSYRTKEPKINEEFKRSRTSFETFYDNYIVNLLDIMIKER